MEFLDQWLWVIFVVGGLLMVLLELVIGGGLDLAIIGSIMIVGGAATGWVHSWYITAICAIALSTVYIAFGRKYIHKRRWAWGTETNIDALIGKSAVVKRRIAKNIDGMIKVGNEEWRARAEEDIEEGEEVVVAGVTGATLIVKKTGGE